MRTVIFLRHGKSDWEAAFSTDHERPLRRRGRDAARVMGSFLARAGLVPDSVITSSALRAQDTARLASEAGGWNRPTRVTRALYDASAEDVLSEVRNEPSSTRSLLLVGHEPTWSETVSRLIGGGRIRFPTAAMARVDLHADVWEDADFGCGDLMWLIPPKLLLSAPFHSFLRI